MRKLIFLPLLLIGCTKDWNCCIEGTTTGAEPPYETINGNTTELQQGQSRHTKQ